MKKLSKRGLSTDDISRLLSKHSQDVISLKKQREADRLRSLQLLEEMKRNRRAEEVDSDSDEVCVYILCCYKNWGIYCIEQLVRKQLK